MNINKITSLAAIAAISCAASGYAASNDSLLDLLVKKGVLSETEATAVAVELKEENKGVSFSSKGKETVKLRFNGRMHFQYDSLDMDDNGADQASTDHFYFRRLRLGAKATHENGLFAETVVDFAENDLSIDKAVAGYEFSDALTGSFGYQKVPFGFQETISSSKIKTIERSAANRFFADDIDFAGRHSGLFAKGDLGAGFSYSAALVNSAQGEGSKLMGASNASNDLAYFGRLQWNNDGLTIGVDGGHQSNNYAVDEDNLTAPFDVTAFTGYVNYRFEGLDLLGEYFSGDLGNQGDVDGYALRAAYKMGKFEPVVRYSYIKADTFEIDTDELIRRAPKGGTVDDGDNEIDSFYVGLNYYHNKSVSFMAGYEMADTDSATGDEVEVDGFRARVQILW
ncbi:MAG: phosphate-selective porin [Bacteroidia bacterium]|jgi:phosphate-selective porin